ncbi:hypothetical protein HK101_003564, partial [Irineochytrium annulatum]
TWTPVQPGTVSSLPPIIPPQSYQLKSAKGCATVNGTLITTTACESASTATSNQIWHVSDSMTGNFIPAQYIFHTPTGKRFCFSNSAANLGSRSGLSDNCGGINAVFFLPAKTTDGATPTAGTQRDGTLTIPLENGYCLMADLHGEWMSASACDAWTLVPVTLAATASATLAGTLAGTSATGTVTATSAREMKTTIAAI